MKKIDHPPKVNSRESYFCEDDGHKREPKVGLSISNLNFARRNSIYT